MVLNRPNQTTAKERLQVTQMGREATKSFSNDPVISILTKCSDPRPASTMLTWTEKKMLTGVHRQRLATNKTPFFIRKLRQSLSVAVPNKVRAELTHLVSPVGSLCHHCLKELIDEQH